MGNNNTTYSYTPDGLSGIVRYNSRASTYTPYAVETDHLGGITALYNSSGTKVLAASYDAWGKRTVTTGTLEFRRGYTGHEHIDGFDLINMNGRVYDPLIGRFLSPDMYVQLPGFSQSFNRYSYCLNNPLKYTDPSGDFFLETLVTASIDFFNTIFFKGGLDLTSPGAMREAWRDFDPTASWSITNKSWKMSVGFYKTDPNKNFWGRAWELISRFTWQSPQTFLGSTVNQVHNIFGGVKSVDYYGGSTVVQSYSDEWGAFTLGNYITGDKSIEADPTNSLFQHEYGHYLQSQNWGPLYIQKIALPSLYYALGPGSGNYPTEIDANNRAFRYFSNNEDGFTTKNDENGSWSSKWNFSDNPVDNDSEQNNVNSAVNSSWKKGLIRLKWYDIFTPIDVLGLINHTIYQLQPYF